MFYYQYQWQKYILSCLNRLISDILIYDNELFDAELMVPVKSKPLSWSVDRKLLERYSRTLIKYIASLEMATYYFKKNNHAIICLLHSTLFMDMRNNFFLTDILFIKYALKIYNYTNILYQGILFL